jgi:triosephosphate isomerase (TIM)
MPASRTPLIAGNWKMNKTSREGAEFIRQLAGRLGTLNDREVVVAPPFVGLFEAIAAARGTGIAVGAQDVFWERDGAYTGAIAPSMLVDIGVSSVIVGHSERRQHFGETNQTAGMKTRAALQQGLSVILCIGETEDQHDQGFTEMVLLDQVRAGIESVKPLEAERLAIAYEPVWAIGTGRSATSHAAQMAIEYVRGCVSADLGHEAARRIRILYGGSVNDSNIDELMAQPDIDGVLVGGASLQLDSFTRIVAFERPAR